MHNSESDLKPKIMPVYQNDTVSVVVVEHILANCIIIPRTEI